MKFLHECEFTLVGILFMHKSTKVFSKCYAARNELVTAHDITHNYITTSRHCFAKRLQ